MALTSATSSNGHHTNGASNGSATTHVATSNGARSVLAGAARRATIGDIAAFLNAELVGNAETPVTGVAGIESAEPGAILFVENERLLKAAFDSSAAAIIAPSSVAAKVRRAERRGGKPTVLTGNPRLAFAKVMEYFQPLLKPEPGIHPPRLSSRTRISVKASPFASTVMSVTSRISVTVPLSIRTAYRRRRANQRRNHSLSLRLSSTIMCMSASACASIPAPCWAATASAT
jgi:hypothetical protein